MADADDNVYNMITHFSKMLTQKLKHHQFIDLHEGPVRNQSYRNRLRRHKLQGLIESLLDLLPLEGQETSQFLQKLTRKTIYSTLKVAHRKRR